VTAYITVDMSWVLLVLMIFHACGTKLTVEATAAQAPMMVIACTLLASLRLGCLIGQEVDQAYTPD
jgi:hypothetical protein